MTTTDSARTVRTVVGTPGRSVRAVPAPEVAARPRSAAFLPGEKTPTGIWSVVAAVGGVAIPYLGAIAVPTGTSYNLREVERRITAEETRNERLTAQRSRLLSLPSLLGRARKLGVVQPAPVDVVLAPKP
ncbi:MAG: hypothetical protein ACKO5K_17280 [Armatimonadota bacterium]